MYEATRLTGNKKYAEIATAQAEASSTTHVRPDWTTFHVINFDQKTRGATLEKRTHQGRPLPLHEGSFARICSFAEPQDTQMTVVGQEAKLGVSMVTLSVVSDLKRLASSRADQKHYEPAERTSWTSQESSPTSSFPFSALQVFQSGTLMLPNHARTMLQQLRSRLEACRCSISYCYQPIKLQLRNT